MAAHRDKEAPDGLSGSIRLSEFCKACFDDSGDFIFFVLSEQAKVCVFDWKSSRSHTVDLDVQPGTQPCSFQICPAREYCVVGFQKADGAELVDGDYSVVYHIAAGPSWKRLTVIDDQNIEFSHDGRSLITYGACPGLKLWDLRPESASLRSHLCEDQLVWRMQQSPDGCTLLYLTDSRSAGAWTFESSCGVRQTTNSSSNISLLH